MNVQQISKGLILGIMFFGSVFPAYAADCGVVSRNLWVGMSGSDVKVLQEVLNRNKETQLATEGPGSPGNETTYFGSITKAAVMRFQEIYKDEVLIPVGLTSGSGYVGTFTRAKMVALCNKPQVGTKTSTSVVVPVVKTATPAPLTPSVSSTTTTTSTPVTDSLANTSTFQSDAPIITFPSSYTGIRGSTLTISGVGLALSGNVVHLDEYVIATTTTTGGEVSFVVPDNVSSGRHALWISSSKGETNKTFFIVTDTDVAPPVVLDFSPKEGFYGTVVTVTGTGFLLEGNDIDISYGMIKNIPSVDGKVLKFTVAPPALSNLSVGEDRPELDIRDPQGFYIMNSHGISDGSVFYLKI